MPVLHGLCMTYESHVANQHTYGVSHFHKGVGFWKKSEQTHANIQTHAVFTIRFRKSTSSPWPCKRISRKTSHAYSSEHSHSAICWTHTWNISPNGSSRLWLYGDVGQPDSEPRCSGVLWKHTLTGNNEPLTAIRAAHARTCHKLVWRKRKKKKTCSSALCVLNCTDTHIHEGHTCLCLGQQRVCFCPLLRCTDSHCTANILWKNTSAFRHVLQATVLTDRTTIQKYDASVTSRCSISFYSTQLLVRKYWFIFENSGSDRNARWKANHRLQINHLFYWVSQKSPYGGEINTF